MKTSISFSGCAAPSVVLLVATWATPAFASERVGPDLPEVFKAGARAHALPPGDLAFIENLGQWPQNVRFLAEGQSMFVRADCEGIGLDVRTPHGGQFVRLRFEGSQATVVEGSEPRDGLHSYFLGNDPSQWRGGARAYGQVTYRSLYPGVDLVLRSHDGVPEYDLVFAPYVDPSCVRVRIEGLDSVEARDAETLRSAGRFGSLLHVAGATFHAEEPDRVDAISTVWFVREDGALGIHVDGRDPARTLVVDPGLVWSTFLGGMAGDLPRAIEFDADGDIYVASDTYSPDFPVTPGAYQQSSGNFQSISVTKYRGQSGALVYSSVFGGTGYNQRPWALTVDRDRRAIVVGETRAPDFPTTQGAYDALQNSAGGLFTGFVTALVASGTALSFSTVLEGTGESQTVMTDVAITPGGDIVVSGGGSPGYPTTPGAYQEAFQGSSSDGVVSCLSSAGARLLWSTFLGGTSSDAAMLTAVDESGRVYYAAITSSSTFPSTSRAFQPTKNPSAISALAVGCLSSDGVSMLWGTFVGGTGQGGIYDNPYSISLDALGGVFVCGDTTDSTFPTTPGAFQRDFAPGSAGASFVTRIAPGGGSLVYGTFIHGDVAGGIGGGVADPSGVLTLFGGTVGPFPTVPGSYETSLGPFNGNPTVLKLSPQGDRLFYGTYFGGSSTELVTEHAVTRHDRVAFCGYTLANGTYPTTPNAAQPNWGGGQSDGFVTVLDLFLQGVEPLGRSTPGCLGAIQSNATEMPAAGASSFALYVSAAPPATDGWLVIGRPAASPLSLGGARLFVDLHQPFRRVRATTDAYGYCEIRVPIPAGSAGLELAAQFAFPSTSACPAPTRVVASNALKITVQ